jgi:hypothetical protein
MNHTEAVKRIGRYLVGTINKIILMEPMDYSFQVFADADCGGLWD